MVAGADDGREVDHRPRARSGGTVHALLTHSVAMIVPTSASIASMAKKTGTTLGSKKKLSSAQIMSR
jgi:hypothetical protein